MFQTETELENYCLSLLNDLQWQTKTDINRESLAGSMPERHELSQVILSKTLKASLIKINPQIPSNCLDETIKNLLKLTSEA